MDVRPNEDVYFMNIAHAVKMRATCKRKKVGVVLVANGIIISTGYNGAPEGMPHCLDKGCDVKNGGCSRCVHAEANALIHVGIPHYMHSGITLYTTCSPCIGCMGLLINARINKIVYDEEYRNLDAFNMASKVGIKMKRIVDFERYRIF